MIAIATSGAVDELVIVIVDLPFIVMVPSAFTFILSAFTVVLAFVPFLHKLLITYGPLTFVAPSKDDIISLGFIFDSLIFF